MYIFNVTFNVFFKTKVHLFVSELYIYQIHRVTIKKKILHIVCTQIPKRSAKIYKNSMSLFINHLFRYINRENNTVYEYNKDLLLAS